jgi:hypothetical protein
MERFKTFLAVMVAVCLLGGGVPVTPTEAAAAGPSPAPASGPAGPGWPRVLDRDGNHVILYQPQLKSWQKYRELVADTAISITPQGGKQILGVISWKADTIADVSTRTVYVHDIEVLSSRFPSLVPAEDAAMQQKVHQIYPTMTFTISLDRMIASLEKASAPVESIPVSPDVPTIFVSTVPAISLMVNGKPVLAPIEGTTLQYVVNTNWNLFYDNANYYLLTGKTWLRSKEIAGPWVITTKLPADMAKLPKDQNWDEVLKAVPAAAGAQAAPKVFVTEKPAELIVFQGQPVYAPIPGTSLAYATNTQSTLFIHQPDKQVYVLLSGRWFRAGNLDAPWVYAGNELPADFAKIPTGHSYSVALVSVPGTQVASDAVLLAQVPTTAVVNRAAAEASVNVIYTGEPQFVAITGTTMFYAVNTGERVIRVGDVYHLCFQGIWFVSRSPVGPWKTADSVPQIIYTIPASSPVYNVTYVIVSNPTPTTVQTSYSSGYLGVFVLGMAVGAIVVYGTGYYYPPYIYYGRGYPIYYPYPYTYGCAAVYNPYTGFYGVGHAVYGPYGSVGTAAWYNPTTGMYGRAVTTQNAYGGHTYAQAYNPYTGTYAATSQGHNAYSQWGSSVVTNGDNWAQAQHVTNANGTAGSFQTSKGSEGAGVTGKNGNSGFVAKDANNNNVYAGVDGNVYKKDSNGDWSKYENGGWTPVDPSTGAAQTRKQSQNLSGATQSPKTQTQTPGTAPASGTQAGSGTRTNGRDPNGTTQPAGQSRQSQPATAPTQNAQGNASGAGTMGQLQNDAGSRARGDQLEQQGRGGGRGSGSGRSSSGGGRSPRR